MNTEFAKGSPRWKRRKEARPGEIVAAALELFVEHGYAATRLDDVAQRAGVTKGTMYLYFDGKEALFKAVVRENIVPALEQAETTIDQHEGPTGELIRQLVRGWWQVMGESNVGGLGKLMVAEAHNFPDLVRFYHDEVVKRGHALFARAIQRGIDRGEFRPIDVPFAVRLAISPVFTATLWNHSFSVCDRSFSDYEAYLALHVEVFLRGLAAHPEAAHA